MMLFAELFLILFAGYSLWQQYVQAENSLLLLLISFSLLSFFYLIISFYQIFLGILTTSNTEGTIKVMSFCSFSVVVMGILFKINAWPGSSITLIIGGVSILVLIAIISVRNRAIKQKDSEAEVSETIKSVLSRLVPFLVVAFVFIQAPTIKLYKTLGVLKNDPEAIRLLENCQKKKEKCKEFITYQNEIIQNRNANKGSSEDR